MKKVIILLMVLIFSSSLVAGARLTVNPGEYSVDLVGGDSFNKIITIKWTGETNVLGKLKTTFSQDGGNFTGEEMWANYSANPIVLNPNEPKDVNLTINTIPNISPGIYNIETDVKTEIERRIDHDTDTDYVYITNETAENETVTNATKIVKVYRNRTVVNDTKVEELQDTVGSLRDELGDRSKAISDMEDKVSDLEGKNVVLGVILLILSIFIVVSFVSLWG